ncbi:MAG: Dam family site-specific DNA-(adenine-N6)-methyltransferase [Clostridia bacterium]|nr:Dam family site-specific DNA-(adenine-N6)-methyltransferase [Clostridia bacterium]
MLQYMSARDAAEKWNISQRRVSVLCAENRIPNAAMLGNMWIIPIDAEKPTDARKNNGAKSNTNVHPFIKWAGGKNQLLEILKSNLPSGMGTTITKYAEPFVGGGALLFALLNEYSFEKIYINDNNKELMNAFYTIKNNCNSLISMLKNLQNEYNCLNEELQQEFYYEKRERFNDLELNDTSSIEKATLFIFLNKSCFNGLYRVNKKGKFNVPFGKHKSISICDTENLTRISFLLQNVEIKACDYQDVISFADSSTLVYFDPPYRPLNATSGFTSYTEDQFSDQNQIELANCFKKLSKKGAKVMLSNSDPKNTNPEDNFFDDLYKNFNILRVEASRMINSKGASRGKIKELLIKNY